MQLNVNLNEVKDHTKRLGKLHKSAFPAAVRDTLNNAAFDVKTNTMPASASTNFKEKRKPNFFKANSKVEKATGWSVSGMKATVGFLGNKGAAVKELEQQEHGGMISHRDIIATDKARVGSSRSKMVKGANRVSSLKKYIDVTKVTSSKNRAQKLIRAAFYAKKTMGNNALIKTEEKDGVSQLIRIKSIKSNRKGKLIINSENVASYKKGRKVKVEKTGFMKEASEKSANKMIKDYIKNANYQYKKHGL